MFASLTKGVNAAALAGLGETIASMNHTLIAGLGSPLTEAMASLTEGMNAAALAGLGGPLTESMANLTKGMNAAALAGLGGPLTESMANLTKGMNAAALAGLGGLNSSLTETIASMNHTLIAGLCSPLTESMANLAKGMNAAAGIGALAPSLVAGEPETKPGKGSSKDLPVAPDSSGSEDELVDRQVLFQWWYGVLYLAACAGIVDGPRALLGALIESLRLSLLVLYDGPGEAERLPAVQVALFYATVIPILLLLISKNNRGGPSLEDRDPPSEDPEAS
jgi:hypothetical protein